MIALTIMAKATADTLLRAILSAAHLVDVIVLVVAPDDPNISIAPRVSMATGKRCYVFTERWQGHAVTRGKALRRAESIDAKWVLMIDADDVLAPGAKLPPPSDMGRFDSYDTPIEVRFANGGRWRWLQPGHLMRPSMVLGWEGAAGLHETLKLKPGARVKRWDGIVNVADQTADYSPVRAGGRTYLDDANKLEAYLLENPNDTRAAYYFAQSLRDAGELHRAYYAFLQRAAMTGGFREETFWALLWAAKLAPFVGVSDEEVIARHEDAHRFWPERAEPLYERALVHRGRDQYEQAIALMNEANTKPYPVDARWLVDLGAYSYAALSAAGIET